MSVIMAAYNAEHFIALTIESILVQTYANWELTIVDDASTDSTPSIIRAYCMKDARIKSVRLEKNSGQTAALNHALTGAKGLYVINLDSDDIALPQRFEVQVCFLEMHLDIAAIGSAVDVINDKGMSTGTKTKPIRPEEISFRSLLQTPFVHSSVCMRRNVLAALNGYDPAYLYAEDYDLWSRMISNGYTLANMPEILTRFRVHTSAVTIMSKTQKIQSEEAFRINARNILPYVQFSRPDLELVVNMINGRKLSITDKLRALRLYEKLAHAYSKNKQLSPAYRAYALHRYSEIRTSIFKQCLKQLIGR